MLEEYDRIYSREPVASTHEGFGGFDSWEAFDKANHEWQDELAAARTSLEDYFRTLQREIEALREWKTSVLNALESKPDFQAAEWAGDKRGWGFVFEYINWLHRDRAALLSDNERLRKDREAIGKVVAQCGTCTIRYGSMVLSEKWAAGRSLSGETPK